jgi:integrase
MAKKAAGLSARRVQSVRQPGMLADGGGLYLKVAEGGSKSWIFRYQIAGRRRDMGLGSVDTFTLAEARERTAAVRKLVADGIDPIEHRHRQIAARQVEKARPLKFRECARLYIAAHQPGWRNAKHAKQWSSTMQSYVFPVFGDLPVDAIDVGLVMKVLDPIWTTKPETASRVRGRIESVLDWAAARGYRQGDNPARWRGHLENLLPKKTKVRWVEHHAALPYAEAPAFMAELRQQDGIAARALEFAILTAARTGEVLGATWPEIDFNGRLWVIRAQRMKAAREHRVPLSAAALAVLDAMKSIRQNDFVFPGIRAGQPLSNMAFLMLLRRMGRGGNLTAHGFRSTFSDWCAECTTFPAEVRGMMLAHVVSDKVEAAYRRGDLFAKRAELAEVWSRSCAGSDSHVTPLRLVEAS